tara:strand:+ start:372 stop:554 length:183 start_codon:yes stop_codon:yes gene_type:complete
MKVKLAVLLILVVAGGVAAQKYNQFKESPTGQVIEQIQEKKQLIEDIQKSPTKALELLSK